MGNRPSEIGVKIGDDQYTLFIITERQGTWSAWRERMENMRKAQKKQAEDFIKLLDRAHNEVKRAMERKDRDASSELLEQCKE